MCHWFVMQVGMILGFFTAWPVNRRTKEKMDFRKHLAMMIAEMRERTRKSTRPIEPREPRQRL